MSFYGNLGEERNENKLPNQYNCTKERIRGTDN